MDILCELIDKWTDVVDSAEPDDWDTINMVTEFLDDLKEIANCGR